MRWPKLLKKIDTTLVVLVLAFLIILMAFVSSMIGSRRAQRRRRHMEGFVEPDTNIITSNTYRSNAYFALVIAPALGLPAPATIAVTAAPGSPLPNFSFLQISNEDAVCRIPAPAAGASGHPLTQLPTPTAPSTSTSTVTCDVHLAADWNTRPDTYFVLRTPRLTAPCNGLLGSSYVNPAARDVYGDNHYQVRLINHIYDFRRLCLNVSATKTSNTMQISGPGAALLAFLRPVMIKQRGTVYLVTGISKSQQSANACNLTVAAVDTQFGGPAAASDIVTVYYLDWLREMDYASGTEAEPPTLTWPDNQHIKSSVRQSFGVNGLTLTMQVAVPNGSGYKIYTAIASRTQPTSNTHGTETYAFSTESASAATFTATSNVTGNFRSDCFLNFARIALDFGFTLYDNRTTDTQ